MLAIDEYFIALKKATTLHSIFLSTVGHHQAKITKIIINLIVKRKCII